MRGAAIALIVAAMLPGAATAAEPSADPARCAAPPASIAIIPPLERVAARIEARVPLTIVAVGSSSTSGIGASGPAFAYPSRLQAELQARLPNQEIHVVNRGKGGEDAPEEFARLAGDVVALHPDLAIWQVGTNAVLRRDDLAADGELIRRGVDLLSRDGIDVVLMDLQYAPRVLERTAYPLMERLVAEAADEAHVGLFRRFELMRYWQRVLPPAAPPMVGADGLHMTDAGYGCLAADMATSLEANWRAESKLAHREHNAPDAVAGLPHSGGELGQRHPLLRRNDATPFE
jgi:lysophospholipase L1-like esterase